MVSDPFGLTGQVIEGQFRVERVVGEGGFSAVYFGMHLGLNEPVAIKCLKLSPDLDPELAESFGNRFRDEGRLQYRLSRGNLDIVRCINAGTTRSPITGALVPYMVLEWLDGRSLGADLRERRARGMKGRTLEEVVALFDPAVNAVAYAHSQGVVHRDLKPGNLFLTNTREGVRLKVLDFGLAKVLDESLGIVPMAKTVGHHTVCSPSYGAPEQFDPSLGKIGPWTDVYSLGLLVLELLRDKKVRTGEGIAQCAIEALNPKSQPTAHSLGIKVRPQVEVALARAVALDVSTRPPDAGAFWTLLKNAMKRTPTSAARAVSEGEMATVADAPSSREEPTAASQRRKIDLESTAHRDVPLPREAFRSDHALPPGGLGGTLVMPEGPGQAPQSSRPRPAAGTPAMAYPVPHGTMVLGGPPPSSRGPQMPSPVARTVDDPSMFQHVLRQSPNGFASAPPQMQPQAQPYPPSSYGPPSSQRVPSPQKKRSTGCIVLFVLLFLFGALGGGGWAAYRYVLVPRGITLPHR